ncbi:EAL domain-containing protein [Roseibium aggregatum]|nr:EAL domain-containing protein [Roseibium aggregatum]
MSVIALSAAAVLVFQFGRPFGEAVSLSLALMCTMIMFHLLVARATDRSAVSDTVDRLEDRMVELDEDVGNLEGRLTGVERNIPRRTREEIDPLFAEVEVLGSLVKQMAEAMTDLETRFEDQQRLAPPPAAPGLPNYQTSAPSYGSPGMSRPASGAGEHYQSAMSRSELGMRATDYGTGDEYGRPYGTSGPDTASGFSREEPASRPAYLSHEQDSYEAPEPSGIFNGAAELGVADAGRAEPRPDPAMRELITAALNANRVELHLQPIVTLPQRQVKYYEAFTRLRDAQGDLIAAATFLPEAVRAGLIARIDNLLLFRSIQVIRRLTSRNRNAALFCNISSSSLVDETFFPGFLDFASANKNIADVLIFEFSQDDVARMGVVEMESLSALAEIGFHFSIDRITDMKMDFKSLAQRGFKFAKLHADYLIGRRSADHGHIHPSDFGDLLHRYGMELITDHVETESQVLELLDYEVKLAQGNLFSPPRPVRAEVLQGTPAPAPRKRAAG